MNTRALCLSRPGAIYQEAAEREAAIFKLLNNSVATAVFSLNAAQYKVKQALWIRLDPYFTRPADPATIFFLFYEK